MTVGFTPEAAADLERIADTIAADNPRRAITYISEIRDRCLGLAAFPEAFPLLEGWEPQGVRRRVYQNYIIFYRIAGEAVQVIRILHGAMDLRDIGFPL
jgi:toxin ParE1/3/4